MTQILNNVNAWNNIILMKISFVNNANLRTVLNVIKITVFIVKEIFNL